MRVAKFGRAAELAFSPMLALDPVREEDLAQFLRQFCDDALRGGGTAAEVALAEAAVIVRSVLADAAHRWNATLPVADLPPKALSAAFAYLTLQDRLYVSRVCRSWRRFTLAEPHLWNRISLKDRRHDPLYNSDVIPWYNSDFVHGVLARATGVLVDLRVYELHTGPYAEAFLNALPDVMSRLRSLHVEFAMRDPDIDRLTDVLSVPAPFLEQLTLQTLSSWWSGMNGRGIGPPFCAPRLRSVSITGVAFSSSLDPLPSVSKVTLDLGRSASRVSWMKHLFALFPNVVEVSLPDFGGAFEFPSAPAASHGIQSLTIGHEGSSNPQSFLPLHWHLARIAFISLRWASHKTARELLAETFPETATPRVLSITGYGTRIALSDAAGAIRRECDLTTKDFTRLLGEPALFATVTNLTLIDRCAPDPVWKLGAALPALTQLTILIADSGQQKLLTRADSTRGKQTPRHPTLETVVMKEDPEWDTSKNVPKGPYPPTVVAPEAERVLRARVGLAVAPDGSSSPRVVSRGVLIENADQTALNIVIEEEYRTPA